MDKLFRHVKPARALDVGANIGEFTKQLLSYSPDCKVVMIEANPHCEPHLKTIGQPYDITALSNRNGISELYIENSNHVATGASLYKENTQWYDEGRYYKHTVITKTLDGCNYFDGAIIDLIKLDVQGSELNIIKGGENTIKTTKFVLAEVSLLQYNQGAPLIDDVVEKMVSLGFCIVDIVDYHRMDNVIFQMDILFKNLK